MSSSASPSGAPSAEYAEDPLQINQPRSMSLEEYFQVLAVSRESSTRKELDYMVQTLKVPPEKSWTTWFKRVSASKRVHWDEIGIGQALDLTIANSAKDEPLMAAASYFWSNTINAFLFNQGPMTPTLIDISMITGLDVTSSANPMSLNTKNQYDFKTKSIGGWSGYVAAYMGQGSVTPREHVAFLLMWLEKFLFYGSSCGPTTNWQFLAEALETKRQFPLGKILLGYLYQMLNNASAKIAVGSVVGAVMKVVNRPSVSEAEFPRLEPIVGDDGEERTHRRCTSYGEYASTPTDAGAKLSVELLKDWFCSFYEGFQKDARVWFLYEDSAELEHPLDFRFEDINHEIYQSSREIFLAAISPCILPVGIHQGRNIQASYEFYHPMSSARQLGMGQLPIGLFFADKIQCRGEISSTLMMHQLLNLQGPPLGNLFSDVVPQTTESSPPRQSNSGKDIQYAPGLIPNGGGLSPPVIGYDAPKTSALLQGLIREPADADKKRKTRSSAVNIVAPTKKKKTKKTKPADDLPTLDSSIEQALDEEIIEDKVDQAAAEKKKTTVKKKSAATTSKPAPPPSPPPSPPVQQTSSDQTPSAVGSHHVEEEEQPAAPAIPVLADLFSFDIRDYLDEGEEDTTSKTLAPLSDDVKKTLGTKLRLAERRERKDIEATIQANRQLVHEEKFKLDQLSEGPIKSNIDRLEAHKIEHLAQLEECNAELDMEHKKLADLPKSIEKQKARLKSAIKHVADLTKSLKVIPGTDAQDAQAIEEVEQIRQKAISAIQRYLSQ
ncbi:aminotransferase-like protein [Oryza sativa Japonica Group]|uniref:Aminotransferase-like protein n=1 Tax=Oryza sativa subsp. japonica TaxID=39947 RepID=Q5ZAY3_ORYSJ|nr:aminotransferase-like protein [Oryza sativa Japonica Group]